MATNQMSGIAVLIVCSILKMGLAAEDFSSNATSRPSGIDTSSRYLPRPPVNIYSFYGGSPGNIRSQVESSITAATKPRLGGQQQDNQPSNAELDEQNARTDPSPGNDAQLPAIPQPKFPSDSLFNQRPQFNAGAGQIPTPFPNGYNFGPQPSQFNYGFGPPGFNQNTYSQSAGSTGEGQTGYQQNYQPFNFRTNAQLDNQFNLGQNGNSLPAPAAQTNNGQFSGVNNNIPGLPAQPVQNFGQLNGFPFPTPNVGQGFQQQFNSPGFSSGAVTGNAGQTSANIPSDSDQRSVVGFYGGAPNLGGYAFNNPPLQGQQQDSFNNPGAFPAPNFGQFTNGASQLGTGVSQAGAGVTQLGGGFSGFGFNPASFQDGGGLQQQGSFSNRVINQSVPIHKTSE